MTVPVNAPTPRLADVVRSQKEEILAEWEGEVRRLPAARDLSGPVLRNGVPALLDRLVVAMEATPGPPRTYSQAAEEFPRLHALERLEAGFDLRQVAREFSLLRRIILSRWEGTHPRREERGALTLLNEVLDEAVFTSVSLYTQARNRTLAALDRVSHAAMESRDLPSFLTGLIRVLVEMTPSVDTVAILLPEGEELVTRAAQGLEQELAEGHRVPFGSGFAGTIASTRQPLLLREAHLSEMVLSQVIRQKKVRALFGVPMVVEGELVGVAEMGSTHADEFSEGDRLVFHAMVERAAAVITQHRLRDALDRERFDFVNIIVHDIRTPLTAIAVIAHVVQRQLETGTFKKERVIERLGTIRAQVDRTNRLLSSLLDIRMLESGRLEVTPKPLPYQPLLEEVALEWQAAASAGHQVELQVDPDLQIRGDPDRVLQVLHNLLSNAVKYSPRGGEIRVTARRDREGMVLTTVTDQGIGMAADQLGSIFERYVRQPGGRAQAAGHGLGLYVSAQLIKAHGGRMWAESTEGKGTSLKFTLPAV